jgi:hypothetical protein
MNNSTLLGANLHPISSYVYNFDFNPAISVGGIDYGDDTQYKFSEKTTAHDEQIDNITMDSHSAILHFAGANNYVMTKYGDVAFEASDMIIIYLEVLSISSIDDVAPTSVLGVIIFFWGNIDACFNIVNCDHSNRIPAASDCVENVYGYSSAFHSVSWHATSELIMHLIRYDISTISHIIYISVINNTKDISAYVYLSYSMRTTRLVSISMFTGSINDDYIFANSGVGRYTLSPTLF